MSRFIPAVLVVAAFLFVFLSREGAQGDQLLVNGGFESGTQGWASIDGVLSPDAEHARSGAFAGAFQSTTTEQAADAFQWVQVQSGETYEFAGWVYAADPNIERVFLRVSWFNASNQYLTAEDSPWLTGAVPSYRFLTTTVRTAPPQAASARVSITVQAVGPFTAYFDDFTLGGPTPHTPTPTLPPVPTATATAGSQTVTPSMTATPWPTQTLTGTPTPVPPGTPSVSPTATDTSPPATPTTGPTVSPVPTAAPTLPSTPSPAPEPTVFANLTNGGFEAARGDGTPYGWRKIGGVMGRSASPVRSGGASLSLESATTATKWAYQAISVRGGEWYEAAAFVWKDDPGVTAAFVRVSWYASGDGSGEALFHDDSPTAADDQSAFVPVGTGPVQAPEAAQSAKVRLMVRPGSAAPGRVYFDDVTFLPTAGPGPEPTQAATLTATPSPVSTATESPSTSPTTGPAETSTPSPTPAPTPTGSPRPVPIPTEPDVFDVLTNGGFEEAREDGTPYGWHKVGGEIAVTDLAYSEGSHSLQFTSRTNSTKWAYQTVRVIPGAHYRAASRGQILGGLSGLLLRVSWYASEDGSGSAIDSADSEELSAALPATASDAISPAVAPGAEFQVLTTGVVQAPVDARSARVRLLVRPQSEGPGTAHFDAVVFEPAEPAADDLATRTPTPRPTGGSRSSGQSQPGAALSAAGVNGEVAVLGVGEGPGELANIRPAPLSAEREGDGGDGEALPTWLLLIAIVVPSAAIAALLALDSRPPSRADND